jgi:hypothetical protein
MLGMPEATFPELLILFLVKSLLILTVGLALAWFMRRSSAAARHLCLAVTATALLVLPLGSFLLPAWHLGPLPDTTISSDATSLGAVSLEPSGSETSPAAGTKSTNQGGTAPVPTSVARQTLHWQQDSDEPLVAKNQVIWILGELRDSQALPVLQNLRAGEECDHERFVCQYELNKAIGKIEGGREPALWRWIRNAMTPCTRAEDESI